MIGAVKKSKCAFGLLTGRVSFIQHTIFVFGNGFIFFPAWQVF